MKSKKRASEKKPPTILALVREQHHHIAALTEMEEFNIVESKDWQAKAITGLSPDLLITLSSEWFEAYTCIQEARKYRIPSLYIMDGILEWRHQWENPRWGSGGRAPYNQPLFTDKAACIGWRSIRTLQTWGNVNTCELVGIPRFDHYLEKPVKRSSHEGRLRLLVMTANTPGFTPDQLELVAISLKELSAKLAIQDVWEPVWRINKEMKMSLGLSDRFPQFEDKPLRDVLSEVDAVVTTPSTVVLESMLMDLPTAILDYSNSPQYIQSAWIISSPAHFVPVLRELEHPPANRMVFQDEILHDCLECYSPATPRLVTLISRLIQIGKLAREKGLEPSYPQRILPIEFGGHAVPSIHFDFASLYPEHPVFKNADLNALQHLVIQLSVENSTLRRELRRSGISRSVIGFLRRLIESHHA